MLVGFIFLGTYQMISKVLYIRKIRMQIFLHNDQRVFICKSAVSQILKGDVISIVRKYLVSGIMIDDEYEDSIVGKGRSLFQKL